MKKLQEKNKLIKAYQEQNKSTDDYLKERENGFQLYVNGVHNKPPPRRPSSGICRRLDGSCNRNQTPAPLFSNYTSPTLSKTPHRSSSHNRRQWTSEPQTKIKTEQGSIIADIHSQILHKSIHKKKSSKKIDANGNELQTNDVNSQMTYRIVTPVEVDQSWMPDWFRNTKSQVESNEDNHDDTKSLCKCLNILTMFIIIKNMDAL